MKKKSYADMDPLEEIQAIKEEISREFKTPSAYIDYLQKKYHSTEKPAKRAKKRGTRSAQPTPASR